MKNILWVEKILKAIDYQPYKIPKKYIIDGIICTHIVPNENDLDNNYKWVVCNEDWEISLLTELTNRELQQLYKSLK